MRDVDALFESAGDPDAALERLRRPYRELASGEEPIVLFGCGAWGRHTAARLAKIGMQAVAFADNATRAWGTTVCGLPVLSPAEAVARFGATALFVVTIYNGSVARAQLASAGCRRVLSAVAFYRGLSLHLLPYYQLDLPDAAFAAREEIARVQGIWHDDLSRQAFAHRLAAILGLPTESDEPVGDASDCYFDRALLSLDERDHVVDCGAFDGDTVRRLRARLDGRLPHVVALEPDPVNAAALRAYVETLPATLSARVDVIERAASSAAGTIAFDASGSVSARAGEGEMRVSTVLLDELPEARDATFVKMDVEGHEFDALVGARRLLATRGPALAISLYHRLDDLWRIPALIRAANPSYRLFLRFYAEDGWEGVCYAIPAARMLSGPPE